MAMERIAEAPRKSKSINLALILLIGLTYSLDGQCFELHRTKRVLRSLKPNLNIQVKDKLKKAQKSIVRTGKNINEGFDKAGKSAVRSKDRVSRWDKKGDLKQYSLNIEDSEKRKKASQVKIDKYKNERSSIKSEIKKLTAKESVHGQKLSRKEKETIEDHKDRLSVIKSELKHNRGKRETHKKNIQDYSNKWHKTRDNIATLDNKIGDETKFKAPVGLVLEKQIPKKPGFFKRLITKTPKTVPAPDAKVPAAVSKAAVAVELPKGMEARGLKLDSSKLEGARERIAAANEKAASAARQGAVDVHDDEWGTPAPVLQHNLVSKPQIANARYKATTSKTESLPAFQPYVKQTQINTSSGRAMKASGNGKKYHQPPPAVDAPGSGNSTSGHPSLRIDTGEE
jgi:hypothetical protein